MTSFYRRSILSSTSKLKCRNLKDYTSRRSCCIVTIPSSISSLKSAVEGSKQRQQKQQQLSKGGKIYFSTTSSNSGRSIKNFQLSKNYPHSSAFVEQKRKGNFRNNDTKYYGSNTILLSSSRTCFSTITEPNDTEIFKAQKDNMSPARNTSSKSTITKNKQINARRVWKAENDEQGQETEKAHTIENEIEAEREENMEEKFDYWNPEIIDSNKNLTSMRDALDRVGIQERQGGRMRQSKLGVLRECPQEDMRLLVEQYTVPALASALRDREDILQLCASLLEENKLEELSDTLRPYNQKYVNLRRQNEMKLDLTGGYDASNLEIFRKALNRMPRRVSQAHQRRAGVVLPLCNVNGVPCILFEKRSQHLRAHPDEVCLPGGMVSAVNDTSIVATCLREMQEEISGLDEDNTTVLGVLRCNWGEVHHLVNVAVTPVVCYVGEIGDAVLKPNPDEVAECFTVPLALFLKEDLWVHRQDFAPIFTGGPYMIWGLTGYIMNRFVKDILARYRVEFPPDEVA